MSGPVPGTASAAGPLADAYGASAGAWRRGPARIYDRLAEVLVDACPTDLDGALAVDLGAGTGAASLALLGRGARVVAVDVAVGMLLADRHRRPPAVAADALALPCRTGALDAVVAAFSLNHLADPAAAMAEVRRALRPGGALVAGAYADDDTHPVKAAVDEAATARGWRPEPWYLDLRRDAAPQLATPGRAVAAAATAGLVDGRATTVRVPFPDLDAGALVAWRLGMAHLAPFVAGLPAGGRAALVADALDRLGPTPPPLERSIVVLVSIAPGAPVPG